jgi:hypothetical protein
MQPRTSKRGYALWTRHISKGILAATPNISPEQVQTYFENNAAQLNDLWAKGYAANQVVDSIVPPAKQGPRNNPQASRQNHHRPTDAGKARLVAQVTTAVDNAQHRLVLMKAYCEQDLSRHYAKAEELAATIIKELSQVMDFKVHPDVISFSKNPKK